MTVDPRSLVPRPDDRDRTGTNDELDELRDGPGGERPDFEDDPESGTNSELPERVREERER